MILIFGGAYQGKLDYALLKYKLTEYDVYTCSIESIETPMNKKIIYALEKWILALIKSNIDTEEALQEFISNNKENIIICCDISCGVVPVEKELRKWREAVGKALTAICKESSESVRIFCGLPTVLHKKLLEL